MGGVYDDEIGLRVNTVRGFPDSLRPFCTTCEIIIFFAYFAAKRRFKILKTFFTTFAYLNTF
jgi:hypothetical protein